MSLQIPRRIGALLSILMVVSGVALILWSYTQMSAIPESNVGPFFDQSSSTFVSPLQPTPNSVQEPEPDPSPTATPSGPLRIGHDTALPAPLLAAIHQVVLSDTGVITAPLHASDLDLRLDVDSRGGLPIYSAYYAAAGPFNTIETDIESRVISQLWRGETVEGVAFQAVGTISDTLPGLRALLGASGPTVRGYEDVDGLIDAAWSGDGRLLVIVPFDRLSPELQVLSVDGQNPVENENRFDKDAYPLVLNVYARGDDADLSLIDRLIKISGATNRNPDRLTVVAMTGVTALVRFTAQQMDRNGPGWPAEVVGPELSAADITHISNEVPFVPDCVTNIDPNNLTFCSKPEYMETLRLVGADIIGLTGNHQNDYGRDDAQISLDIYAEEGLPVYGGGRNREEAFAPLYIDHNGNRLAFLGANFYGPPLAWAREDAPGSAEFDLNILSATIRNIRELDRADVILTEIQYQETYSVQPLWDQRQNFQALIQAGSDIVTGVQSHVPQAVEFEDGRLILHGLGNLFFDQMWDQATREGMIVKHTIYDGRHISTRILTTLLYESGQPRWTSDVERRRILERVFGASYWERPSQ